MSKLCVPKTQKNFCFITEAAATPRNNRTRHNNHYRETQPTRKKSALSLISFFCSAL